MFKSHLFWVDFFEWFDVRVHLSSFTCGYAVFLFTDHSILFPVWIVVEDLYRAIKQQKQIKAINIRKRIIKVVCLHMS